VLGIEPGTSGLAARNSETVSQVTSNKHTQTDYLELLHSECRLLLSFGSVDPLCIASAYHPQAHTGQVLSVIYLQILSDLLTPFVGGGPVSRSMRRIHAIVYNALKSLGAAYTHTHTHIYIYIYIAARDF
jgi:hypothetical protein